MRYVYQSTVFLLSIFAAATLSAQNSGFSITNYQLQGQAQVSATQTSYTYRADLVNTGTARPTVTAGLSSLSPAIQVVPGRNTLIFSGVQAQSQTTSGNTFTVTVNNGTPVDFSQLQWTFLTPIANAGPSQSVKPGAIVMLNGTGSSNPSGAGNLTYRWSFVSRPPGTSTVLFFYDSPTPFFSIDIPGTYIVSLTVSNGFGSDTSFMTVSTSNIGPVANAGPDQSVGVGATVTLSGGGSSDADGDPLSYSWTLIGKPAGSSATLANANTFNPTFVVDKAGIYTAQLIVNDGTSNSTPSIVVVSTQNTAPVANAGPNQVVGVGATVQLNGAASTDADGNTLTYLWSLITRPAGSTATLSSTTLVNPTFPVDVAGTYVAQLTVFDGQVSSPPATVTISTGTVLAPTALAGLNQTVAHNTTVTVHGSGSDPQNLPLTYQWSITTKPAGSAATLSSAASQNPTFFADKPGNYILQLIVSNGTQSSAPATVTITTGNTAPVANAGNPQNVALNTSVSLDGSGSSDADHDPLTYAWTLTSRPAGSNATLNGATTATPSFTTDVAGPYVAQLIVSDPYSSSTPVTVMITAAGSTGLIVPSNISVPFGQTVPFSLTLGSPAPSGGVFVSLQTSDSTTVSLFPSNMYIPQGATSPSSAPQITGLKFGSANITATAFGYGSATGTVKVIATTSFSPPSTTITPGTTQGLGLILSTPAPLTGLTFTITSSNPAAATVPASVTIAANQTSIGVPVTGVAAGSTTITATPPNANITGATAAVTVASPSSITLPATTSLNLGQTANLAVALSTPAPAGGVTVSLLSSDASKVTISPASVTIAAGATTPVTQPQVKGINIGSATIAATAPGFGSANGTVQVGATLTFSPTTINLLGAGPQNVSLTLSGPAPAGGLTVTLHSDNTSVATVQSSVGFGAGSSQITVLITGVGPGSTTVHAIATGIPDATITVNNGTAGITLSNVSVAAGASAPLNITLPTNAPAGGVLVTLTSNNPAIATVTPSSVLIPAGSMVPPTPLVQVNGVTVGNTTITASATGYTTGTSNVTVTGTLSFAPPALTIASGSQNFTLTLSAPAPAGGLTVNTTSSNSAAATVPVSVQFAPGALTATLPVTAVAAGSAVIHASALPNVPDATGTVTVTGGGGGGGNAFSLPANVTLIPGQTAPFQVTATTPAPAGGYFLSLSSSDPTKVSISPANVFIPQGSTTPFSAPVITGVNYGAANITATAIGVGSASQQVTVGGALTLSPNPLTMTLANAVQNLNLSLPSATPTALTIALSSSNPSVATVPASITIPAGSTLVNIPVTSLSNGSTTISANANNPAITNASTTVTVVPPSTNLIIPASTTLNIGQTLPFPVSLGSPAGINSVTVTLSSNTPGVVAISPSTITIPAGATTPTVQPTIFGPFLGSVTITASAPGYATTTGTVQVTATMTWSPAILNFAAPGAQNIRLVLSGPGPPGYCPEAIGAPPGTPCNILGLEADIASDNPAIASVQQKTFFLGDGSSQSANVITITANSIGTTTIRATSAGIPEADLIVNVGTSVITLMPNVTVGPTISAAFPVTLSSPAPAGGVTVSLVSSDTTKVTIPASVAIAAGSTTPAVQPQVTGVNFGSANITATAPGYSSATQAVTVGGALSFAPPSIATSTLGSINATLNLSVPAPAGGLVVNLASTATGVATVASTVTIPAGAKTVNVALNGVGTGSATINATTGAPNVTAAALNLTINPVVLTPAAIAMNGGNNQTKQVNTAFAALSAIVTDAGNNPVSGVNVTFTAPGSGASGAFGGSLTATVPTNAFGIATAPTFTANGTAGSFQVSATVPGVATPALFSLTSTPPNQTLNFVPNSVTITTSPTSINLNLGNATPSALTITLASSDTTVATVPATVTIPANGTTIPVSITALKNGSVTITATAGALSATANVTVNLAPGLQVPATTALNLGQSLDFPVTISAPQANYTFITLTSADPTRVTISPDTITIPPGATAPLFPPQVKGVSLGTVAITASASGFASVSGNVTVTANMLWIPTTLNFLATGQQNVRLQLSGPAPPGYCPQAVGGTGPCNIVGLTATLTSDNPNVATLQSTTTFLGDGSSQSANVITITATGLGTTTIRATAPGIPEADMTVVVGTSSISLTPNITVGPTQSAPMTVTLSTPAPAGGLTVALASSDTTKVTVNPASVTIAAGATTPAAQPQVTGVNFGSANITATASGYTSATQAVKVAGALSFSPSTQTGGIGTINATLNLSVPAPTSGLVVNLQSSATSVASVPATVTIPAGLSTVNVPINGVLAGTATITASTAAANVSSATLNLTVNVVVGPPSILTINGGNNQSTAINTAFPTLLSVLVTDSSNNPVSGVSVTFTANAVSGASGTFTGSSTVSTNASGIATAPAFTANGTTGSYTVTAASAGLTSATFNMTNTPVQATLNFSPSTITITNPNPLSVNLVTSPAPASALTITLASSDTSIVTVPATVTIPANGTSIAVPMTALKAGSVTITATAGSLSATANVTANPPAGIVIPATTAVNLGQSANFPVSLTAAQPTFTFITLTSSDPSKVTLSSTTISIPPGNTAPVIQPQVTGVGFGSVTITATASGLPNTTGTVNVGATLTWNPTPLTFSGTGQQTAKLQLSGPAPSNLTVTLTSDDPTIAGVQSTTTIFSGQSAVNLTINGLKLGSTNIHANVSGLPEAVLPVTVSPLGAINVTPSTLTVGPTQSAPLTITLGTAAPAGGVSVLLSSSDTTKVTVSPANVFIAAGATQPVAQPQVTGVNFGSATITASGGSYTPATATVTVGGALAFAPSTMNVAGNAPINATLNLSVPAPVGGLVVNLLSSTTSVANVPATVTVPAGATTTTVPITVVSSGSTTITASSSAANITSGTLSLTIANVLSFTTNSLPAGQVNIAYQTTTLQISGGTAPFTYAITSGTLPNGLNFNTSTGTISGTPTVQVTNLPLTFKVTDSGPPVQNATVTLNLTVQPPTPGSVVGNGGTGQTATVAQNFAQPLSVLVKDVNNLPAPGIIVSFSAPSQSGPSATFGGSGSTTATTDANGIANVTATANQKAGNYVVSATVTGLPAIITFSLINAAGAPSAIAANTGTPQTAAVGATFGAPLQAKVTDAFGNVVQNASVTFAAPAQTGASATYNGPVTVSTSAAGLATSPTLTANNFAGNYNATATVTGVATPANFALTNTAGAPASITATGGASQQVQAGAAAATMVANVKDSFGNNVPNVTVTFAAPPTGASNPTGTFVANSNSGTATTDANGNAPAPTFTANGNIGPYIVTGTVGGVATPANFSLSNTPGPPFNVTATAGISQNQAISTAFGTGMQVTVTDKFNNPLSGVLVTFTAPTAGANVATGAFGNSATATATTDASGKATAPAFTAGTVVGTYSVNAAVSGVAQPAVFTMANTHGPAASIIVAPNNSGNGQQAIYNTAYTSPLVAIVKDAGGNPVPQVTVTFAAPNTPASVTFNGSPTSNQQTDALGQVSSGTVTANGTTGTVSVTASVATGGGPVSTTFTLTNKPGNPASIAVVTGSGQTVTVGNNFAALTVIVKDANNNPVPNATVSFAAPGSGASGTFGNGNTATTDVNGQATSSTFRANTVAGGYAVNATVNGVATAAVFNLTNSAGPAASITPINNSTPQQTAAGSPFPLPLSVFVADQFGNPVSNATVTFSAPNTGPTVTFNGLTTASATTNASGNASSPTPVANATSSPNSYFASATVNGINTSFTLKNTPPATALISLNGVSVGQNLQAPVTITLSQGAGTGTLVCDNPAPQPCVTLTVTVSDPSKALLSIRPTGIGNPGFPQGQSSVSIGLLQGDTSTLVYVQGLANTGSVTLNVVASNGYAPGGGPVNLTPSGILISGPNGGGTNGAFSIGQGSGTTLTATLGRLDSSMNFIEAQSLSASFGATAANNFTAQPITANYTVIGTGSGSVAPTSVTFQPAGSTTATNTFTAGNPGSVTITAVPPSGLSTPATTATSGNSLSANIVAAGIVCPVINVGQNLQANVSGIPFTGAAPAGGVVVTLTSNDPSKLLFGVTNGGGQTIGSTGTVSGAQNFTSTGQFQVEGLGAPGPVTYNAVATNGFGSITCTANITPSGLEITATGGAHSITTTTGGGSQPLTITSVRLDSSNNFVEVQPIRPNFSVTANVGSNNTNIATVAPTQVTINGPNSTASVTMTTAGGAGTTSVAVNTPVGLTAASNFSSLAVTANQPSIGISDNVKIGKNLELLGTISLGQAAPSGGTNVTLTSNNPGVLLLSADGVTAGASSIIVNVPFNTNTASYYLISLSNSGTASYSASANGFTPRTASNITLTNSGFIIVNPNDPGFDLSSWQNPVGVPAGVGGPVSIQPAQLDSVGNFGGVQALAPGFSASITVTSSAPGNLSVTSPVIINGGTGSLNAVTNVNALSSSGGQGVSVNITQPGGYTIPAAFYYVPFVVF